MDKSRSVTRDIDMENIDILESDSRVGQTFKSRWLLKVDGVFSTRPQMCCLITHIRSG